MTKIRGANYDGFCLGGHLLHTYTMSLYTAKVLILLQNIVVHSMVSDTCIFHDSDSDRGHFVAG